MTLGERIKEVRKNAQLKQSEFGDKLGVKEATVTSWETDIRSPSEPVIRSICRLFNVNEKWLRNETGDMQKKISRTSEISDFLGDILKNDMDFRGRLIAALAKLTPDQWKLLEQVADNLMEEMQKEKPGQ